VRTYIFPSFKAVLFFHADFKGKHPCSILQHSNLLKIHRSLHHATKSPEFFSKAGAAQSCGPLLKGVYYSAGGAWVTFDARFDASSCCSLSAGALQIIHGHAPAARPPISQLGVFEPHSQSKIAKLASRPTFE
jgi:hypothetical protein